jgi:hypothetical protein
MCFENIYVGARQRNSGEEQSSIRKKRLIFEQIESPYAEQARKQLLGRMRGRSYELNSFVKKK